jgi:hypothetical protein
MNLTDLSSLFCKWSAVSGENNKKNSWLNCRDLVIRESKFALFKEGPSIMDIKLLEERLQTIESSGRYRIQLSFLMRTSVERRQAGKLNS